MHQVGCVVTYEDTITFGAQSRSCSVTYEGTVIFGTPIRSCSVTKEDTIIFVAPSRLCLGSHKHNISAHQVGCGRDTTKAPPLPSVTQVGCFRYHAKTPLSLVNPIGCTRSLAKKSLQTLVGSFLTTQV